MTRPYTLSEAAAECLGYLEQREEMRADGVRSVKAESAIAWVLVRLKAAWNGEVRP